MESLVGFGALLLMRMLLLLVVVASAGVYTLGCVMAQCGSLVGLHAAVRTAYCAAALLPSHVNCVPSIGAAVPAGKGASDAIECTSAWAGS